MWLAYCHLPCFAVNCAISFYLVGYRRDRLIGTCAYRLQRQENMRLLYVCAYYRYYYTVETWYLSNPSLSDKDAVYLIESVVGGLHIRKRVRSPTVFEGLQPTCKDRNDDRIAACLQV